MANKPNPYDSYEGANRPDPNDVGVLYVSRGAWRQQQKAARFFDPGTIRKEEQRDGVMRMFADPVALFYNQGKLRFINDYRGMWK